ncbi:MAG: methylated-DNA--[Oscillospiraceae bacterium]|nr:methylated-DNA--[protein]-cysteine S-methyltransferase [Oscillospiraceae bacterium]
MEHYCETPLGICHICVDNGRLTLLQLMGRGFVPSPALPLAGEDGALALRTAQELAEYFAGQRTEFDLPVDPAGTAFQKKVWEVTRSIPYGKTVTYGQLAAMAGHPGAARAAGGAMARNPVWIVTPCHRVLDGQGKLHGYSGGLHIKEALLKLEGVL